MKRVGLVAEVVTIVVLGFLAGRSIAQQPCGGGGGGGGGGWHLTAAAGCWTLGRRLNLLDGMGVRCQGWAFERNSGEGRAAISGILGRVSVFRRVAAGKPLLWWVSCVGA